MTFAVIFECFDIIELEDCELEYYAALEGFFAENCAHCGPSSGKLRMLRYMCVFVNYLMHERCLWEAEGVGLGCCLFVFVIVLRRVFCEYSAMNAFQCGLEYLDMAWHMLGITRILSEFDGTLTLATHRTSKATTRTKQKWRMRFQAVMVLGDIGARIGRL